MKISEETRRVIIFELHAISSLITIAEVHNGRVAKTELISGHSFMYGHLAPEIAKKKIDGIISLLRDLE